MPDHIDTDTEATVRTFLVDRVGCTVDGTKLTADYPLLERGALDSLGVFKLISLIEEHWDIEIEDDALLPENFATISRIAALVDAHLA